MTNPDGVERFIVDWLSDAGAQDAPRRVYDASFDVARRTRRARPLPDCITRWLPMSTNFAAAPPLPLARPRPIARLRTIGIVIGLALLALALVGAALLSVGGPSPAIPAPVSSGLIAYDSNSDIWVAEQDGTRPRVLVGGPNIDTGPVWSPDGTHLAFWSQPDASSPIALAVVRADGSMRHQLVDEAGIGLRGYTSGNANIDWSPDGAYLLVGGSGGALLVGDLTYDRLWRLDIGAIAASAFDWSPDGSRIAVAAGSELYVLRPDSLPRFEAQAAAAERQVHAALADDAESLLSVEWSPDSSRVAYTAMDPAGIGSRHDLVILDADTGATTLYPQAADAAADRFWPTWSPDGSSIAVGSAPPAITIVASDAAGPARSLVTDPITTEDITWSPDGRSILAFAQDLSGLRLIPVDGSGQAVFIATSGPVGGPSWQRDEARPADPEAAPLIGHTWTLSTIQASAGIGKQASLGQMDIGIEFSPDGGVSGHIGCQRYASSYRATAASVTFGPFDVSEDTCGNGSMTGVYFQLLSEPLSWTTDSNGLTLGTSPGGVALFRADG
jgi:Tol biopolymer transport system component/heat shock protein HslJ